MSETSYSHKNSSHEANPWDARLQIGLRSCTFRDPHIRSFDIETPRGRIIPTEKARVLYFLVQSYVPELFTHMHLKPYAVS